MKRFLTIATISIVAVAAFFVGGCGGGFLRGQKFDIGRMAFADSVINEAIADGQFPGAVLCVVRRAEDGVSHGDVVYLKAYGNRQVVSGRDAASGKFMPDTIAMTTDAVFDLASLSKCVGTTLSFMHLLEEGKVRLSDNVAQYIPDFKSWEQKPKKRGDRVERESITIEHLLTHTSGLAAGINPASWMQRYEKFGDPMQMNLRDSLISYLAVDAPRMSRPGEKCRYSCLNFIVLQAIIEKTTSMRLDEYARESVFEPLRLKNTWYNDIDNAAKPFSAETPIVPTEVMADGGLLCGEVHDPTARIVNRGVSGNAGLFSTAEDLAVIASMLMNGGVIAHRKDGVLGLLGFKEYMRLYGGKTIERFFTVPELYAEHGRALGWDSGFFGDLSSAGAVNHTGYTGTSLAIDVERGVAVILLTNRVHPHDDGSLGRVRALISNIVASAM